MALFYPMVKKLVLWYKGASWCENSMWKSFVASVGSQNLLLDSTHLIKHRNPMFSTIYIYLECPGIYECIDANEAYIHSDMQHNDEPFFFKKKLTMKSCTWHRSCLGNHHGLC